MAGSIKFFRYVADDGSTFAAQRDESNVEAVNPGVGGIITPAEKYKIPSNLTPRSAVYADVTGRIRRDIIVLSPTVFAALDATTPITDQVSGESLRLKFKKGERLTLPNLSDTALNDGDAD